MWNSMMSSLEPEGYYGVGRDALIIMTRRPADGSEMSSEYGLLCD
jgi:hypothetical protein